MMAKEKKQRRSFIVIFFVIVLCACFAIPLLSGIKNVKEAKAEKAALEAAVIAGQAENDALNDKINSGNKDEYVEEIARENGYIMPGEKVYQDISVND